MANNKGLTRIPWRLLVALVLIAAPLAILAQQRGAPVNPDAITDADKTPYDKHDFSGLWARNPQTYGLPACNECRDVAIAPGYGFFGVVPPRTPEGEKRLLANKPGRGYELNSKDAKDHPDVDSGYKRAVLPAFGNDPGRPLRTAGPDAQYRVFRRRRDHGNGHGQGRRQDHPAL